MTARMLIPVVLCGGVGSRLWPVSREMHPKPFIRMGDGQSLLQKAFLRGAQLPQVSEIFTITNRELLFKTEDDYREVNGDELPTSYILEPFGRNTAAAVATAALNIASKTPDAILLILAADHLTTNQSAFEEAVQQACALAESDMLVTFGIKPSMPETGYGYIEAENNKVLRFVEKPDKETAINFLESGNFLWNSGIFCFKASLLLDEMRKHCPEILSAVESCLSKSRYMQGKNFIQCELESQSFACIPEISIDCALMEKSNRVAVVPCEIGWSDIGSWAALGAIEDSDEQGNRVEGLALLHEVQDCFIRSEDRLVGAVGLNGIVIVDTPDALLVASKEHAQDVRHVYSMLKASNHELHRLHRTVYRPWGDYTVLEEGDRYKIKRIVIKPGQSISLQLHHHRSEHWIVVNGMARVTNSGKEVLVAPNESTYIPAGHQHRVSNPGLLPLVMIEVQSGEYLGEDDIVRFEDIYDRA